MVRAWSNNAMNLDSVALVDVVSGRTSQMGN